MEQNKHRRIDGNDSASNIGGEGFTELEVLSISGECLVTLNVSDSMCGRELWNLILDEVPTKPGLQLVVSHTSRLVLNESLKQQGLGGQRAQVSATYIPGQFAGCPYVLPTEHSVEDEKFSLNGITEVTGVDEATSALLHNLPKSLRTLTFAPGFNQRLDHVRLPGGLQSLTFGWKFNRNLDNLTWPAGLQSLNFGTIFQSEPGQRDMASRPSKFDFWRRVQSEPGQRDMASRPSKFDFWCIFQSDPGQRDMASSPSKFDLWREF